MTFEDKSGTALPWRVVPAPLSYPREPHMRSIVDGNGIYVAMNMQPAVADAVVYAANNIDKTLVPIVALIESQADADAVANVMTST